MYLNLLHYSQTTGVDLFDLVPESYYISSADCSGYSAFLEAFESDPGKPNVWLLKPAENTFGGFGIMLFNSKAQAEAKLKSIYLTQPPKTDSVSYVAQRYIDKPLLFEGRKFDIRVYFLLTSFNSHVKAYWYPEGYVRTSSSSFNLDDLDNLGAHLTNDCYQKKTKSYGKFEDGNKVLYNRFFKYLENRFPEWRRSVKGSSHEPADSIFEHIETQMKTIATHLIKATSRKFDPLRRLTSYELVGLDFMIDSGFKVLLIEANNSPSLSHSDNRELNLLLEEVMEAVFQVAVDPLFPPPRKSYLLFLASNPLLSNKFSLFYDEVRDFDIDLGEPQGWGYQPTKA